MRERQISLFVGLITTCAVLGCFDDPGGTTTSATAETSGDGDGDPAGDGDGDATGDGDGDTGDGDGDTGDGDGDATGDGDGDTGDGDGDEPPIPGSYRFHIDFPGFANKIGPHAGGMLMVGSLNQPWDGGGEILVPEASDLFLLGFSEEDGTVDWSHIAGGIAGDFVLDAAFYGDDRVAISTTYYGESTTYGGQLFPASVDDNPGSALVGFVGLGDHAWSLPVLSDNSVANGIDVDGALKLLVGGRFTGPLSVGPQQLPGGMGSQAYYLRVELAGDAPNPTVLRGYGGPDLDQGMFAEYDDIGGTYLGGMFEGNTNIDGQALDAGLERNAWVARIANNGDAEWVKQIGGEGTITLLPNCTANDASGKLLVGGSFQTSLSFDGQELAPSESQDAFVLRLTTSGELDEAWIFPNPGNGSIRYLEVADNGDILFGGEASGGIDLGEGMQGSEGSLDAFVLRTTSAGEYLWSKTFGSTADDRVNGLGFDMQGRAYAGISYLADIEIADNVELPNDGGMFRTVLVAFE